MMRRALALARARAGLTGPNPPVGCVLVDASGDIVGEAATGIGGRPHAEEEALRCAGERARGASAFVTLEPCARRSRPSPSCAERLIEAGVVRVTIACEEINRSAGGGMRLLAAAGIEVAIGPGGDEARRLRDGVSVGAFRRR